jgi:hypothetical protein
MRNTSTPRVEATTIAAMVPRDMCDEELEIGFTLVEQLEFRDNKGLCTYNCDDAVVTLIEPMAKRLSTLVMVNV